MGILNGQSIFKYALLLTVFWLTQSGFAKRIASSKKIGALRILPLTERIQLLNDLVKLDPMSAITLSLKQYRQLVHPAPRNFSVFVLFHNGDNTKEETDKDEYCEKCGDALAWWNHVASIHFIQEWRRKEGPPSEPVYFAQVKIYSDTYLKVKLPVEISKPNMYYFANTTTSTTSRTLTNLRRIWRLNVSQFKNDEFPRSMNILDLIGWISDCSGVFINLRTEPLKLTKTASILLWITFTGCLYCIYRFCNITWIFEKICGIISNLSYKYWAVVLAIWCVSGQMFNQIMGTGWAYLDENENIGFVSRSHNYQMLSESLIVMALYGIITFALIQLIQKAEDAQKRKEKVNYDVVMGYFSMFIISFMAVLHLCKLKQ